MAFERVTQPIFYKSALHIQNEPLSRMEYMQHKFSYVSLSLVALISIFFLFQLPKLQTDYSLNDFFSSDAADTRFWKGFQSRFDIEEEAIFIGLRHPKGIFQPDFLQQIEELSDSLKLIPEVQSVQSPTDLHFYVREPLFGLIHQEPYLHPGDPEKYASDSLRIYSTPIYVGSFFSEDGKAVTLRLSHTKNLDRKAAAGFSQSLHQLLEHYSFPEVHLGGTLLAKQSYIDLMQGEMMGFIAASLLLIMLFLWISFRTFWGIWVPLLVVSLAVVWLLGFLAMSGQSLNLLSNILPSILLVVGLSAVVHILSHYHELLRNGWGKSQAIMQSLRKVGTANFLTTFTTALGFLTLCFSPIVPIQQLGLYAAVGVCLALLLSYVLLPAILFLVPPPPVIRGKNKNGLLDRVLNQAFGSMLRRRKQIGYLCLGAALLALLGVGQLRVNHHLLEDLRGEHAVETDLAFFEKHFAGLRSFELSITLTDSSRFLEPVPLQKLADLETFLTEQYGLGKLVSPLTWVKMTHQAHHGGDPSAYILPENERVLLKRSNFLRRYGTRSGLRQVLREDEREARIGGQMADLGSSEMTLRNARLQNFLEENWSDVPMEYHLTGIPALMDQNHEQMALNLILGLGWAFAVVAGLVGLLFRSWRMIGIALLTNGLPLLLVGGLMGWLGIEIKLSTAIIFTIAFGIAVDDTLHMLSRLRAEWSQTVHLLPALQRTFLSTGRAMVLTSGIICGGFLTLGLSSFYGTSYLGFFICLTLGLAVLADLFLLPVLLLWLFPDQGLGTRSFTQARFSQPDYA